MLNNQEPSLPVFIKDLGKKYPTSTSKEKRRYGLYQCKCGKEFEAQIYSVKCGNTKSCGCHNILQIIKRNFKHGLRGHRLNSIYRHMIQRTTNSNNIDFLAYGARGIIICDEWSNDFMSFYNWAISNGYSDDLSIDRINNDGNYEPSNCRFTTQNIQSRNTRILRSCNTSGYRGVSFHKQKNKYGCKITVDYKQINLGYFDTAIEAAKVYDNYVIVNNLEHTINGA